ncbi:MAG TPA: hypothetical protein ENI80_12765 [Acidiferrobacteraceae bacterium]|nr:hypothetical protein [Acidiferrobacteraceae bacterium]
MPSSMINHCKCDRPRQTVIALIIVAALFFCGCDNKGDSVSAPLGVDAPAISWTPIATGLPGAPILDLAMNPSNTANFFAASPGGLYQTTDSGLSWSPVIAEEMIVKADAVAIAPGIPSTIYIAKSGIGVSRSIDNGATWLSVNNGLTDTNVRLLTIDPTTPSIIYAGTGKSIYKSIDSAGAWTELLLPNTNTEINAITIDPADTDIIYVATGGAGVLKSPDGGTSWSTLLTELTNTYILSIAVDSTTPGIVYAGTSGDGIFKSVDGGTSWVSIGPFGTQYITTIKIDPTTPTTLYAGGSMIFPQGVYKSVNSGANWDNVVLDFMSVFSLAVDPVTPTTIIAGGQGELTSGIVSLPAMGGVYLSTDGGTTWTDRNNGMTNVDVKSLLINPTDTSIIYAATDRQYLGLHISINGGMSWTGREMTSPLDIKDFATNPLTPYITYAVGTRRSSQVFEIIDQNLVPIGFNNEQTAVNAIVSAAPSQSSVEIYIGTDSGVYKSTDFALNWTQVNAGLANTMIHTLAVDPVTQTTLYAGTDDGVFKSTDSGSLWQRKSSGLTTLAIDTLAVDPSDPDILYAGTSNGIFQTKNAAQSWAPTNSGLTNTNIQCLAIDPTQTEIVYTGTADGFFRSVNQGQSWTGENDGLYVKDVESIAIDPDSPATIYIGTTQGGIFKTQQSNP